MFDPYHKWLGIPKDQRPPTYYQLLGIAAAESDLEVIEEAAIRQTTHLRAYQTGAHAVDCTRLLNEVAQARATLTNAAKRQEYDARLAAQRQNTEQPVQQRVPAVAGNAVADAFTDLNASPALPRVPPPRAELRRDWNAPPATTGTSPALVWGLVAGGRVLLVVLIVLIIALSGGNADTKPGDKDSSLVKTDKAKPKPPPRRDELFPLDKGAEFNLDVKRDSDIPPKAGLKPGPEWDHIDLTFATVMDGFVRIHSNPRIAMGIDPQRRVVTRAAYSGPLDITVVARTADENIRIQAPQGAVVIFNWEANRNHLAVHRPDAPQPGGFGSVAIVPFERLQPDTWYTLRWRIADDGMEISVDGKVVFAEKRTYTLTAAEPVAVGAMRSPVDVKSFDVKSAPRVAKKENPPPVLPNDTPLDQLDAAKVPAEDRHAPFGDSLVAVLKGHTGEIFAVEFAANGKWLASTGNDGKVIVWSPADAEPMRIVHEDRPNLAGLAVSPDSTKLAFATRQELLIFEVGKWDAPLHKLPLAAMKSIPTEMAWSPNGKVLACSRNDQLTLLDMTQDPPAMRDVTQRQNLGSGRMNFTADGHVLATSAPRGALLWDCTALRPTILRRLDAPSPTKGTAISPDGKKLVVTCMNLSMHLWDLDSNRTWDTEGHDKRITFDSSARFSPDGKTILTTGLDLNGRPQATWRSAEDFTVLREWRLPERSSQVAFDATGRYAAFTSHNRKLYVVRLPAR